MGDQRWQFQGSTIRVLDGDITTLSVDAIVNAANSSLMGGGGVDGAIHRAGGAEILDDCRRVRQKEFTDGLPTGKAAVTVAGALPCKYVIHTVGPIYDEYPPDESARLLSECYRHSLDAARARACRSLAFSCISCGVYGYPNDEAADVAIATTLADLEEYDEPLEVVFCVFGDSMERIYLDKVAAALAG
jgi:O-acetyl-ADP-ribose deacetylase (regulator of RNase III)